MTTTPVFKTVNFTAIGLDSVSVTFNHSWYLFALIWGNQKNDFIVTHYLLLMVCSLPAHPVRQGVRFLL